MQGLMVGLSAVGKFFICLTFNLLFIYTPELYPTSLRATGISMASCTGTIGGMLAPYIILAVSRHSLDDTILAGLYKQGRGACIVLLRTSYYQ